MSDLRTPKAIRAHAERRRAPNPDAGATIAHSIKALEFLGDSASDGGA